MSTLRTPLVLVALVLAGCRGPGGPWREDLAAELAPPLRLDPRELEDEAWGVLDASIVEGEDDDLPSRL